MNEILNLIYQTRQHVLYSINYVPANLGYPVYNNIFLNGLEWEG